MIEIRRIFTHVESIAHEFGPPPLAPLQRGAIGVVMSNPYAGRYESNILPMMDALGKVGIDMAERLRAAMNVSAERIQGYGKGAIVGANGELEHGALWHVPGGYAMRELLGWKGDRSAYAHGHATQAVAQSNQTANALSIVPSTKKVGAPGTALDVPMTHINASYVRSHFDAMEARVSDAPRASEIVVAVVVTDSGRPLARVGGLQAHEAKGLDGLR